MLGQRILILSPHMDDGIIGSCGLICRHLKAGGQICYVSFSFAKKSLMLETPSNATEMEFLEAMRYLKIRDAVTYTYEVRVFPSFRQEILERLIDLRKSLNPDVVIMPSMGDLHQDHKVIAEEGFRAFKNVTLLGYEMPRNMIDASPRLFVRMEEVEVMVKLKALEIFKSQMWRPSFIKMIESLNQTRGLQVGATYAESYEVIRWVL